MRSFKNFQAIRNKSFLKAEIFLID